MLSNSPVVACLPGFLQRPLRAGLYRDLGCDDFRPSTTAGALAAFGALSEGGFPLLLALGGRPGLAGLVMGLGFHAFILSNVALGVPQEWNVFCAGSAVFLFGPPRLGFLQGAARAAEAAAAAAQGGGAGSSGAQEALGILGALGDQFPGLGGPAALAALPPLLLVLLAATELAVPLLGNLCPRRVSFLLSRRYYAGNWPGSIWLVRKSAWSKIALLPTASPPISDQLATFYAEPQVEASVARLMGFRALHLPSRVACAALGKALAGRSIDDYKYMDGEFVAAWALGYNFGCGYLHGRFMLAALQERLGFEEGECLHLSWDSVALGSDDVPWCCRDAAGAWDAKPLASGTASLVSLAEAQPFDVVPIGKGARKND